MAKKTRVTKFRCMGCDKLVTDKVTYVPYDYSNENDGGICLNCFKLKTRHRLPNIEAIQILLDEKQVREKSVPIRLSKKEYNAIKKAAEMSGMKMSTWMRNCAVNHAS